MSAKEMELDAAAHDAAQPQRQELSPGATGAAARGSAARGAAAAGGSGHGGHQVHQPQQQQQQHYQQQQQQQQQQAHQHQQRDAKEANAPEAVSTTPNRRAVPRKHDDGAEFSEVHGHHHHHHEGKDDFGSSPGGYGGAPLLSSGGFVNSPAGGSLAGSDGLASPGFGIPGFMPHFGGPGGPGVNTLYGSILLQQLQSGFVNQQNLHALEQEAFRKLEANGTSEPPRPPPAKGKAKSRKRTASGAPKNGVSPLHGDEEDEDDDPDTSTSIVTNSQTGNTRRRSRRKSSVYRGVSRCAKDGRWQARIRVGRKVVYIGRYKTEIEAARNYDIKAKEYHKARAVLNFKDGAEFSESELAAAEAESNARVAAVAAAEEAEQNRRPQTSLDPPAAHVADKLTETGEGEGDKDQPKKKGRRASAMPSRAQSNAKDRRNSVPPQVESNTNNQLYRLNLPSFGGSPVHSNNPVLQSLTAAGIINNNGLATSPSELHASLSSSPINPHHLEKSDDAQKPNARPAGKGREKNVTGDGSAAAAAAPSTSSSSSSSSSSTSAPKSSDMKNAANGLMSLVDKSQNKSPGQPENKETGKAASAQNQEQASQQTEQKQE
ncbi:AP2-like ethylene-responsive transcription factor PLT2 [Hondaea fermentalgiana]|uniref:AP2-like ethylene-responsive transcription factor PLT2 n=1 Tax=Hondaea fermentalgiana TaxID=2315210 RepID=A0A2R5G6L8_9STRA|nr:AP2-like ethylene-responsive transcription factor PLT2 [Hondaea fermentalgiana]|eukprot:GBG24083.1 AP2-like ethylene-responsive transcription factor PLT2 [Hondaea fermentalgiana]